MRRVMEWTAISSRGPLVIVRRILLLILLTLSFSTAATADELQVSFSNVEVTKGIPPFSGTYSGSWLWDTSTDTISDVIVHSTDQPILADRSPGLRRLVEALGTGDLFLLAILTSDQTASLNFFPRIAFYSCHRLPASTTAWRRSSLSTAFQLPAR